MICPHCNEYDIEEEMNYETEKALQEEIRKLKEEIERLKKLLS